MPDDIGQVSHPYPCIFELIFKRRKHNGKHTAEIYILHVIMEVDGAKDDVASDSSRAVAATTENVVYSKETY